MNTISSTNFLAPKIRFLIKINQIIYGVIEHIEDADL
jgi:hypothetical protein